MDRHYSLGLQQDILTAVELYLDHSPSLPPENCTDENCHTKLSTDIVDTAAFIVTSYFGLHDSSSSIVQDVSIILQAYFLHPVRRAGLLASAILPDLD